MTLWSAQLLPVGVVRYKSLEVNFTPGYLAAVVRAFDAGAVAVVPFQHVEPGGEPTADPGRCRGEVRSLEVVRDGLEMVVDVGPEGDLVLRNTPALRAAPRLVERYKTADGRVFLVVLQFVFATEKPVAQGLRPFRELDS